LINAVKISDSDTKSIGSNTKIAEGSLKLIRWYPNTYYIKKENKILVITFYLYDAKDTKMQNLFQLFHGIILIKLLQR